MISILRRNSIFLALWSAAVLSLTLAICLVDKGTLHLALCDHHTSWADTVMPVLSDLVNWLPYVLCVILLIWRWRIGLFVTGSLLLSTGLVQALKHIVRAPRPLTWFAENMPDVTLPLTEGVKMNYYLSFPSGHTTTFFCLFLALCMVCTCYYTKQPRRRIHSIGVQVLFFALAAVCSYSRIYLSQHFALDVLAGMILGVGSTLIIAAAFGRILERREA